ncbi:galactose-1-epimerase, partial [candidate division KSB1 bacterium]
MGGLMRIEKSVFGKTGSGVEIEQYELFAGHIKARVMTFGSVLIGIDVPDKTGKYHDVTLGYDSLNDYIRDKFYFGAIVGRYAGRIKNGHFRLNGKDYFLTRNSGANHLHGGESGFSKKVWLAEPFSKSNEVGVRLYYKSSAGEEGYPGDLCCQIRYILSSDNSLSIKYHAKCTEPTPVNLANHSYFNLSEDKNILQHTLRLFADKYLPAGSDLLPTGEILSVKGTFFDFSSEKVLEHAINETENGFDNTFVINNSSGKLKPAAVLKSPD